MNNLPPILRPMKMLHGCGINREMTAEERKKTINACLERIKRLGYAGIVTNVDFDRYLESEENWESFRYEVLRAHELGLRVWLYDEHGYPSGGAGGITLRDHPEYEALGLVLVEEAAEPGVTAAINLPRGHDYFISTGREIISPDGQIAFVNADEDGRAFAFAVKRVYEGTHAEHNVHSSRRYINVLDKNAVKAFIDNTYKAYRENLGELFCVCEAIFTDEPSIMAAYLNFGLYPGRVGDEFDDTLPLLPLVPWEKSIPALYKEKWGEDLLPRLGDLFGDATPSKTETRYRFYKLTSEMFENAFYGQIGAYCESAGIDFTGHVLLEEDLLLHPVFEGNIFRFVGKMGIPGIDMLSTIPENILFMAATPKLISSAAHLLLGKQEVMSEVSGHNEGAHKRHFGVREMKASIALQRALGVTIYPSYYSDTAVSEKDFISFTDYTERLTKALNGGKPFANLLLYYPIEAAMAATSGTDKQIFERPHTGEEMAVEMSWKKLIDTFLRNGAGFECADTEYIADAVKSGGVLTDRFGNTFTAVAVPFVNIETPEFKEMIDALEANDIPVFRDPDGTDANRISALNRFFVSEKGLSAAQVKAPDSFNENPVIVTAYSGTDMFTKAFLAVNTSPEPMRAFVRLGNSESFAIPEEEQIVRLCPDTGEVIPVDASSMDGEKLFYADFGPYEAAIFGTLR